MRTALHRHAEGSGLEAEVFRLRALHGLRDLLQNAGNPTPKLLGKIAALLPAAWRYPEVAAARLTIGEIQAATPNFASTRWRQSAHFLMADGTRGEIEMVYLETRPEAEEGPFLAAERTLLDSVAGILRVFFERRRAEAERAFLATIVESSEDAIFVRTLDGTVMTWNAGAERMFGHTAREAIGRPGSMLVPADRLSEANHIAEKVTRGERVEHYETVRLRKDGSQVCVSLTNSPMRDAGGKVSGISTIARDITKRKQLEAQILEINETLQRRVGQDLHDGLSQQLRGIAYLSHVLHQALTDKALPEAKDAARISELLQNALSQTRDLARGLTPVKLEADGLMSALSELASGIGSIYGISCRFTCPEPVLIPNRTTAIHLYRIAQEAVQNAVKHAKPGGVLIDLTRTDHTIKLTVTDDGHGLPKNFMKSTGMGLKIMDYRARTIGAMVELQRRAEGGTALSCVLPAMPWNVCENAV